MSIGGGGDDDIDKLVDEISETNDLLRQLLRGLSGEGGGGGEDQDEDEGDRKGDLWRLGDVKESAISEEDYKDKRAKAARTESYTLPYIDIVSLKTTLTLWILRLICLWKAMTVLKVRGLLYQMMILIDLLERCLYAFWVGQKRA